jgi:hypothetical protein
VNPAYYDYDGHWLGLGGTIAVGAAIVLSAAWTLYQRRKRR